MAAVLDGVDLAAETLPVLGRYDKQRWSVVADAGFRAAQL
jgi:hypothetical protein